MFRIGEYRTKAARLSDYLPWAGFIEPGVLVNKDGSLQTTIGFRGPDLDSTTGRDLVAVRARLNNALRRLGTRWCIHIEAARREANQYPDSDFPDPVTLLIDEQRRHGLHREGSCFDSEYYLTLTWLPPEEHVTQVKKLFIENETTGQNGGEDRRRQFESFTDQVQTIEGILRGFMPVVVRLDTAQTLTYLHGCVSTRAIHVAEPEVPFYIDELITDCPFRGGLSPQLGDHHLKTVSVRAYTGRTVPAMLNRLNELPFACRWVVRYLPLDKQDAQKQVTSLRRQWFAKRKGIGLLFKEALLNQESQLIDSAAMEKVADADAALQELGDDTISYGYLTLTVTVWSVSPSDAVEKARHVQQVIDSQGLVSQVEQFGAVEAWLGSLPGHPYADVRRPMVSSLNLCDLLPISAVWSGPQFNRHLDGPVLLHTRTQGSTPFRLSLHQGDVGHTMIVGPTGAGKSTLLNVLAAQWRRYPNSQVYCFDKGGSSRALTLAVGGDFYHLGADLDDTGHSPCDRTTNPADPDSRTSLKKGPPGGGASGVEDSGGLTLQPLGRVDQGSDRQWAHQWVLDLLIQEGLSLDPAVKDAVWEALENLATHEKPRRTMSLFVSLLQHGAAKDALKPYTLDGAYGHLLDSDHDTLQRSNWQVFETEALMGSKALVAPVLTYLFHRLEERFGQDGPTLLVLDEAWLFLTEGFFAAKIREWLKVLRKKNVAVVFATQSLTDVAESPIASALIENCLTRIFLPNAKALEPGTRRVYESFGLNQTQLEILATATPKQDYYYQSREGTRLFELALTDVELALVGSGNPNDQRLINQVLEEHGSESFAQHYLRAKGLPDAAQRLSATDPPSGDLAHV